ncbi:MAG: MoxR family ATPase [archaeon]
MENSNENLTEQQKVHELYNLIGKRGLYVNTNYDIFTEIPEQIPLLEGTGYKIPLLKEGQKAYTSPLLLATLTSLLNHGTMLVRGAPGIGKTTGVEFAGHFFTNTPMDEILASEIQGHPQLTEEKMVASFDIGKLMTTGEKKVIPTRFMTCPVKVIDEVNRTPPDILSIIMRLADTGKAVYGGELITSEKGPLFATANYSDDGTFELTPPFLDRFDVAAVVTSPQPWDLIKIRNKGDEKLNGGLEELLKIPENLKLDFSKIRKEINEMPEQMQHGTPLVSSFADFLYGTLRFSEAASDVSARATKGNSWRLNQDGFSGGHFKDGAFMYTLNELSVRTAKAIPRYAKAFAWFNGKKEVELSDLKTVLPYLLWHKITPSSKSLKDNPKHSNDLISFVEGVVNNVENEYQELLKGDAVKTYAGVMNLLRTKKYEDKELDNDKIREFTKNAISQIGKWDHPYAITLTNCIASTYNNSLNDNSKKEGMEDK